MKKGIKLTNNDIVVLKEWNIFHSNVKDITKDWIRISYPFGGKGYFNVCFCLNKGRITDATINPYGVYNNLVDKSTISEYEFACALACEVTGLSVESAKTCVKKANDSSYYLDIMYNNGRSVSSWDGVCPASCYVECVAQCISDCFEHYFEGVNEFDYPSQEDWYPALEVAMAHIKKQGITLMIVAAVFIVVGFAIGFPMSIRSGNLGFFGFCMWVLFWLIGFGCLFFGLRKFLSSSKTLKKLKEIYYKEKK